MKLLLSASLFALSINTVNAGPGASRMATSEILQNASKGSYRTYGGSKMTEKIYDKYSHVKKRSFHTKLITKETPNTLFEGFFRSMPLSQSFTNVYNSFKQFPYAHKAFFGTTPGGNFKSEGDQTVSNTMKKKLQIVDIGKKDYKFDPKTSMYYYEDKGTKELDGIKKPELKEFETFVEFDVKKK